MAVITISRHFGAGGWTLGGRLAKKLGEKKVSGRLRIVVATSHNETLTFQLVKVTLGFLKLRDQSFFRQVSRHNYDIRANTIDFINGLLEKFLL